MGTPSGGGRSRIGSRKRRMTLSEDDRRLVGFWAADCAERALPLFEEKAPADTRPREANKGIRAFSRGESGQRDCAPWPGRLMQPRARGDPRFSMSEGPGTPLEDEMRLRIEIDQEE